MVGLRLLERNSSSSDSSNELNECNDICSTIKAKVKERWANTKDFDGQILNTICRVVAAALNPRPYHRSTPQRTLEMLAQEGKQVGGLPCMSGYLIYIKNSFQHTHIS